MCSSDLVMIATQIGATVGLIFAMRAMNLPLIVQGAAPAVGLMLALGLSSILKARLLSRILSAPVSPWRWALVPAAAFAIIVGTVLTKVPEWGELIFGVPLILLSYGVIIWYRGFGPVDRMLFRLKNR